MNHASGSVKVLSHCHGVISREIHYKSVFTFLSLIESQDLKVYGLGWNNGTRFTCTGSKFIVVWESTDLVSWTGPSTPIVSPPEAGMTWAPDEIWDPDRQKFMVFWTSKIDGNLVTLRAFTADFETFTPPEEYVRLGMDNTIAFDDGKYYMLSKNRPAEAIQQNVADSLDGAVEEGLRGDWGG